MHIVNKQNVISSLAFQKGNKKKKSNVEISNIALLGHSQCPDSSYALKKRNPTKKSTTYQRAID